MEMSVRMTKASTFARRLPERGFVPVAVVCAGLFACALEDDSRAGGTEGAPVRFSEKPIEFTKDQVDEIRAGLRVSGYDAIDDEAPTSYSSRQSLSEAITSLSGVGAYSQAWPTKRLYFLSNEFIYIGQLDNQGCFVGRMRQGDKIFPFRANWGNVLDVRHLAPSHGGTETGDFEPTGISESGVVVGSLALRASGRILLQPAWLDSSADVPEVHAIQVTGPEGSGQWRAVSRSGKYAVGGASDVIDGSKCGSLVGTEEWALLGAPAQPVPGPELDARAIPCGRCGPDIIMTSLDNVLVSVNDKGEAVGSAQARDARWSCRVDSDYWHSYFVYTGVNTRPVYVSADSGLIDLSSRLGLLYYPTAVAINDQGEIAGHGATDAFGSASTAFRYNVHTGAYSLLPLTPGFTPSWATVLGINAMGYVLLKARICTYRECSWTAVVWTPDDELVDLGSDVLTASLNDRNEVVGTTCVYSTPTYCLISMWQLPNPARLTVVASPGDGPLVASSTFDMLPSVLSSSVAPYKAGNQVLPLRLACLKSNGEVVSNCNISLSWAAQQGSGGHNHDTDRPAGVVETENGVRGGSINPGLSGRIEDTTITSGTLRLGYTAPEASGVTRFVATANAVVDGTRLFADPMQFTIRVKYGELVAIDAPGLAVARNSTMHGTNNGYGTPALGNALARSAYLYRSYLERSGPPVEQIASVRVTAISLPDGGLFDFETEWSPPHKGHRFGNHADIGMAGVTPQQRRALVIALKAAGIDMPVSYESPSNPAASHWHVALAN